MFLCGFEEKRPLISAKPLWRVSTYPLQRVSANPWWREIQKILHKKKKVDFLMPYPATLISFSSPTWQP